MATLHVCALSKIEETVNAVRARSLMTLIGTQSIVRRPAAVSAGDHLHIVMSDIVAPMDGQILPAEAHIADVLRFVRAWDQAAPLVIHCFAGVSRSTAAAFITACALNPARSEEELANIIRARSPTATPNSRMVALADAALGRGGRMVRAVESIGRGADCFEGVPFQLELR